jgi:hypothetical protein
MNFIGKHITESISKFTKKTLKEERGYFLKLNEPIMVGTKYDWKIIGINQFGHPSMGHDIAVSFSLFNDKQIIEVKKQIDNGNYKIYKYGK